MTEAAGSPAVRWTDFAAADPSLARRIASRFAAGPHHDVAAGSHHDVAAGSHHDVAAGPHHDVAAGPHHVMATIRSDGSPRLSGTNVFIGDEVRIGTMAGALRAADLRRDPRCALHSAPDAEDLARGDARLDCLAREMLEPDATAWFASLGDQPAGGHCFVLMVSRAVLTTVTDGRLQVETWTPMAGRTVTHRQ